MLATVRRHPRVSIAGIVACLVLVVIAGVSGKPAATTTALTPAATTSPTPVSTTTPAAAPVTTTTPPTTPATAVPPPAPGPAATTRPPAPPLPAPAHVAVAVPAQPAPPPPPPPAPVHTAASCYPLTNGGNCYEPGEYCRNADHGASGMAGDGRRIVCADNNGWRWEPA